jgi:hypothetical protein
MMGERSETRIELEQRVRSLISFANEGEGVNGSVGQSAGLALSILGALGAFMWGRRRGRRRRK